MILRDLARPSKGLTLVELLVALGIMAALISILMPAIFASRERAREIQCTNKLRQIGIGVANFHSQMGRLPGVQTFWADLSPSLELGLEQNANQSRDQLYAKAEAFLTCPSETLSDPGSRINYFLNNGSAINPRNGSADFDSIAKPPPWRHLSFRDFTDGLSNTAYMSERMRLDLKTDDRCFWKNGGTSQFGQGEERGLFLDLNEQFELKLLKKQPNYIYFSDQGLDNYFYYDHLWQPNRPIVYGLVIARYDLVIPPSSSHSSGVNLLFSDGSIRPIYDTIDHVMWLAIGSRNGGESESEK